MSFALAFVYFACSATAVGIGFEKPSTWEPSRVASFNLLLLAAILVAAAVVAATRLRDGGDDDGGGKGDTGGP